MTTHSKAYLRILSGPEQGGVYVLVDLSVFDVGSSPSSQIRVVGDKSCCDHHARIYRKLNSWTFFDLNSEAGSFVNGEPVEKIELMGEEIIRVGSTEMLFTFQTPTAGDTPAPRLGERGQATPVEPIRRSKVASESGFSTKAASMRLVVIDGDSRDIGMEWPFDDNSRCLIGRSPDCDLVLNDGRISRDHCRVERRDEGFMVTDLQSSNGTMLNGKRIKTALLMPGDSIRLGYTVICYQSAEDLVGSPTKVI